MMDFALEMDFDGFSFKTMLYFVIEMMNLVLNRCVFRRENNRAA